MEIVKVLIIVGFAAVVLTLCATSMGSQQELNVTGNSTQAQNIDNMNEYDGWLITVATWTIIGGLLVFAIYAWAREHNLL